MTEKEKRNLLANAVRDTASRTLALHLRNMIRVVNVMSDSPSDVDVLMAFGQLVTKCDLYTRALTVLAHFSEVLMCDSVNETPPLPEEED